jgi:excisionase family DNA binding protein
MGKMLLRPAEAAEVLGIGRTKLFELLAAGSSESVRIGNGRRIPRAAIEAFHADLRADRPGPWSRREADEH